MHGKVLRTRRLYERVDRVYELLQEQLSLLRNSKRQWRKRFFPVVRKGIDWVFGRS